MPEASIVRQGQLRPLQPGRRRPRSPAPAPGIAEVSLELVRPARVLRHVGRRHRQGGLRVSRATLYQYFHGKDEIFLELLNECGSALFRVARRIGPLGPDEVGFDNLNWWLGEWSWVFEKYPTMFIQWTAIASSDTKVRPADHILRAQLQPARRRAARRIGRERSRARSGGDDDDGTRTPHQSVRAYRSRLRRGAQGAVDTLSVFLQLTLFPDTPPSVLKSLRLHASADPAADVEAIVIPPQPNIEGLSISDRTAALSKRAVTTVTALAEAGAGQFRAPRLPQHQCG